MLTNPEFAGAVVLWTTDSVKNDIVIDEAGSIKQANKKLLCLYHRELPKLSYPQGFGNCPRFDFESAKLDGLEQRILSVFGAATTSTARPALKINGKELRSPSLILSVSSFETQIDPDDATTMLSLAKPKAILISSWDLFNSKRPNRKVELSELKIIERMRNEGAIVFLDSGNYEAKRY